jgi:hypothetical protein
MIGQPFDLDLSDDERAVLKAGLLDWGGPAHPTDQIAVALGFSDREDLHKTGEYLRSLLRAHEPMMLPDWERIVFATEAVFISGRWGSGSDWRFTTGYPDDMTVELLRSIQRKLARMRPRRFER